MRQGDQFQTSFLFFKKALYQVIGSGLQLSFNISLALNLVCNTYKLYTNLDYSYSTIDFKTLDMLNFDFSEKVWHQFLQHILYMIFQEKLFYYILLNDQISFSDCLYFFRYWVIRVLQLLFPRLWRHKFWNQPYISTQAVSLYDQKVKIKIYIP